MGYVQACGRSVCVSWFLSLSKAQRARTQRPDVSGNLQLAATAALVRHRTDDHSTAGFRIPGPSCVLKMCS